MKFLRSLDKFDWICIGLVSLAFGALIAVAVNNQVKHERGYAAWVKLTGNPKELSYQEWVDMVDSFGQ